MNRILISEPLSSAGAKGFVEAIRAALSMSSVPDAGRYHQEQEDTSAAASKYALFQGSATGLGTYL
jgi:hypothetical protein